MSSFTISCVFVMLVTYGLALPRDVNIDIATLIKQMLGDIKEIKSEVKSLRTDVEVLKEYSGLGWPKGSYGIVSYASCPPGWYEFMHCQDTENYNNQDHTSQFKPSLPKCQSTSFTIRYCFKGAEIPSREGYFASSSGVEAYVIKNIDNDCNLFGEEGGKVHIDNEDSNNANKFGNNGLNGKMYEKYNPGNWFFSDLHNTNLEFCKIGKVKSHEVTDSKHITVGKFDRKFGLFIRPGQKCPVLRSPYGLLQGSPQNFRLGDDGNKYDNCDQVWGHPPVLLDNGVSSAVSSWSVCQYDPQHGS